jgi:hypothetical protein
MSTTKGGPMRLMQVRWRRLQATLYLGLYVAGASFRRRAEHDEIEAALGPVFVHLIRRSDGPLRIEGRGGGMRDYCRYTIWYGLTGRFYEFTVYRNKARKVFVYDVDSNGWWYITRRQFAVELQHARSRKQAHMSVVRETPKARCPWVS